MMSLAISKTKALLKKVLNKGQRGFLKRSVGDFVSKGINRNDLSTLALVFGSDKHGEHCYTQHYQRHFAPLRSKTVNILEIGVGGYGNPKAGGSSLRMWKAYFPQGRVFGIDIYDKSSHDESRIKTFQGSQTDKQFLEGVAKAIGDIDIIIDDGSHINDHVITTFKILFPLLRSPGIYVVEDTQTSYWSAEYGGSADLKAEFTAMNFLKSLVDGLNYEEFRKENCEPSYFDRNIVAMHFYHNLVFIYKGLNNEGGSLP